VAPLLAKDWIVFEIDTDRMKNGKAVGERLTGGKSKGYPWLVILDSEGQELANSDGPDGNIGCPVKPEEAAHFFDMLTRTRQRLSDDELAVLRSQHEAFAAPILESMNRRGAAPRRPEGEEAFATVRIDLPGAASVQRQGRLLGSAERSVTLLGSGG